MILKNEKLILITPEHKRDNVMPTIPTLIPRDILRLSSEWTCSTSWSSSVTLGSQNHLAWREPEM